MLVLRISNTWGPILTRCERWLRKSNSHKSSPPSKEKSRMSLCCSQVVKLDLIWLNLLCFLIVSALGLNIKVARHMNEQVIEQTTQLSQHNMAFLSSPVILPTLHYCQREHAIGMLTIKLVGMLTIKYVTIKLMYTEQKYKRNMQQFQQFY